jgi:anti-anti-sigma factor
MVETRGVVKVSEEHNGSVLVFHLKGKFDTITSLSAEREILDYINKGHHNILLNFAEVSYLSTLGLRMLISTTKKIASLSGHIVLCELSPSVLYVLEIAGIDQRIDMAPSESEGLSKF